MEQAGYTLLALGVALLVVDLFIGAGFALDMLGVGAAVAGAILVLVATGGDSPAWLTPLLIGVAAFIVLSNIVTIARVRSHSRGQEASMVVGRAAIVREPLTPHGFVVVKGERWPAVIQRGQAKAGDRVRIVGVDGGRLRVELEP